MNVSLNFKVEIPPYMLHWIVAQRLWFHCLLNHVSEKNRKNVWGFAVKWTVLWTTATRRPIIREIYGKKRRPSLSLKGIAKAPRQRPEEEIQQKRMKRSVSPRVCQHETAVRRGLYLTNALYYSRPLGKSPVLCAAWWKRSGLDASFLWTD